MDGHLTKSGAMYRKAYAQHDRLPRFAQWHAFLNEHATSEYIADVPSCSLGQSLLTSKAQDLDPGPDRL